MGAKEISILTYVFLGLPWVFFYIAADGKKLHGFFEVIMFMFWAYVGTTFCSLPFVAVYAAF